MKGDHGCTRGVYTRRSQRCLSLSPSGPFAASRCDSPELPLLAREVSQEQSEEFSWSVHDCEANGSRPAQRHAQMFCGVQWRSSGKWLKMLYPGGRKKTKKKQKKTLAASNETFIAFWSITSSDTHSSFYNLYNLYHCVHHRLEKVEIIV